MENVEFNSSACSCSGVNDFKYTNKQTLGQPTDENVDNPSSLLESVKSVICILGATLESFGHGPSCVS